MPQQTFVRPVRELLSFILVIKSTSYLLYKILTSVTFNLASTIRVASTSRYPRRPSLSISPSPFSPFLSHMSCSLSPFPSNPIISKNWLNSRRFSSDQSFTLYLTLWPVPLGERASPLQPVDDPGLPWCYMHS